ncbi:hypothetical protein B7R87_16810 [Streptomyces tsukubensis]|nr:hypothetical protein B7R87_16810 [Streptomyces tsukubensis]
MTREALLGTSEPFMPPCVHCGRTTAAPVVVGEMARTSGPPMVQYACPADAARYGAGPSPEDEIDQVPFLDAPPGQGGPDTDEGLTGSAGSPA